MAKASLRETIAQAEQAIAAAKKAKPDKAIQELRYAKAMLTVAIQILSHELENTDG